MIFNCKLYGKSLNSYKFMKKDCMIVKKLNLSQGFCGIIRRLDLIIGLYSLKNHHL